MVAATKNGRIGTLTDVVAHLREAVAILRRVEPAWANDVDALRARVEGHAFGIVRPLEGLTLYRHATKDNKVRLERDMVQVLADGIPVDDYLRDVAQFGTAGEYLSGHTPLTREAFAREAAHHLPKWGAASAELKDRTYANYRVSGMHWREFLSLDWGRRQALGRELKAKADAWLKANGYVRKPAPAVEGKTEHAVRADAAEAKNGRTPHTLRGQFAFAAQLVIALAAKVEPAPAPPCSADPDAPPVVESVTIPTDAQLAHMPADQLIALFARLPVETQRQLLALAR